MGTFGGDITTRGLPEPIGAEPPGSETAAVFDAATEAMLDQLDAVSDEHARQLRPANTTRSYAADWRAWCEYAASKKIPLTAARRGSLRGFVNWLWAAGAAPSTIDRRITGTTVTLRREHHVHVDPEDTKAARELLKDYVRAAAEAKEPPRGRGQAEAMTISSLRAMCQACPEGFAGTRDRALILMAFAIAGRRSEVAGLNDFDITEAENGLKVEVRVSKTKPRTVLVPYGSDVITCPVRTWRAWQKAKLEAGIEVGTGPAFLRVDRHGRALGAMSGQAVGEVITRAGQRANVKAHLTGHSARAGLATEARKKGKDRTAIAATTGHSPASPVLEGYFRDTDGWDEKNNALIGIGL